MPTRCFLDWTSPLLPHLADRLLAEAPSGPVSFEDTLIIVPTRQAGRRLREYLARELRERGGTALLSLQVRPPSFFLEHPTRSASDPADLLQAWQTVLGEITSAQCPNLLPKQDRSMHPAAALAFGKRLQKLRNELVDADLDFRGVVALDLDFPDQDRWNDLAALEQRYLDRLEDNGLQDSCVLKREAACSVVLPDGVRRIILAAVPDPTPIVLQRLQRLEAETDVNLELWIHAPQSKAALFDEWGQALPEWADSHLVELPTPVQTASPAHACREAATWIQELESTLPSAHLALGLLNPQHALLLDRELQERKLKAFHPTPCSLAGHETVCLIRSLLELSVDPDGAQLRQLLRLPDLLVWLAKAGECSPSQLLRTWDHFANESLPTSLKAAIAICDPKTSPSLHAAFSTLSALAKRLKGDRPTLQLLEFLQSVYEGRSVSGKRTAASRQHLAALNAIADLLQDAARREAQGQPLGSELLLHLLTELSVDPVRDEEVLDAEGWLELPYHPAPALILIGLQEGVVPTTRVADPFLPDSFRQELGLRSDRHLLPRDSYLLQSLLASRSKDAVRILCYKTDQRGGPAFPSRLLFQVPDDPFLQNVKTLFRDVEPTETRPVRELPFTLEIPDAQPITRLSVTAFRAYLACPTRFYLSRALRMDCRDDTKREPDAMDFGTWVHDVLERLLREPEWVVCTQADHLRACADDLLNGMILSRYGTRPSLATRVAKEAARKRLHGACQVQAQLATEGWRTIATELKLTRSLPGMEISGRIDRIDLHPEHGLRLIDYKTSDKATDPAKVHWRTARDESDEAIRFSIPDKKRELEWTDLQLPLYRWLLEAHEFHALHAEVRVGYFHLPKSSTDIGFTPWEDERLCRADAIRAMEWVVHQVKEGVFGPPTVKVAYDEFEHLIQGVRS